MQLLSSIILLSFIVCFVSNPQAQIRILEIAGCGAEINGNHGGAASIFDLYGNFRAGAVIWHDGVPECSGEAGASWDEGQAHMGVNGMGFRTATPSLINGRAGGGWSFLKTPYAAYGGQGWGNTWVRFEVLQPVLVQLNLSATAGSTLAGTCTGGEGEAALERFGEPIFFTRVVYQGASLPPINREVVLCPGEYRLSTEGRGWVDQVTPGLICYESGGGGSLPEDDYHRGGGGGNFILRVLDTAAQCHIDRSS